MFWKPETLIVWKESGRTYIREILVGLVTDSLNVSANIDIDSDPKGLESLKPLLFGKNLDGHTYGKS